MDPSDHVNHFVRSLLQHVISLVLQTNVEYLLRIDPDIFLSAFTWVDGQIRTGMKPWLYAPGHKKGDTTIGKEYPQAPSKLPIEELLVLRNSDNMRTRYPFGRAELGDLHSTFNQHCKEQVESIPLCIVAEEREGDGCMIGGRELTRKRKSKPSPGLKAAC